MFLVHGARKVQRWTEDGDDQRGVSFITGALEADQSALDVVANNVESEHAWVHQGGSELGTERSGSDKRSFLRNGR